MPTLKHLDDTFAGGGPLVSWFFLAAVGHITCTLFMPSTSTSPPWMVLLPLMLFYMVEGRRIREHLGQTSWVLTEGIFTGRTGGVCLCCSRFIPSSLPFPLLASLHLLLPPLLLLKAAVGHGMVPCQAPFT